MALWVMLEAVKQSENRATCRWGGGVQNAIQDFIMRELLDAVKDHVDYKD